MTWILWILSVSGVLIGNRFFIFAKRKEKRKRNRKEGIKELKQKAPCKNSNLVIPFKHDQVLLNFQC
jgi:cytochrome c-type biogenesis protein CcmH/NrfF